jgi:hypothetical protein
MEEASEDPKITGRTAADTWRRRTINTQREVSFFVASFLFTREGWISLLHPPPLTTPQFLLH